MPDLVVVGADAVNRAAFPTVGVPRELGDLGPEARDDWFSGIAEFGLEVGAGLFDEVEVGV